MRGLSGLGPAVVIGSLAPFASAGVVLTFTDVSGLSAEAEFTLIDPTTVEIRLRNTSTGVPGGFDSSDQLLTGLSWDSGAVGIDGALNITGGSAAIGATSASVNFSTGAYGPGADIGGEWGFGNMNGTGALVNMISGNTAGITAFGGANLDGPASLDGPQGGLVADPMLVSLGGLGAIQDEILVTIDLSASISDIFDLFGDLQQARVEFGSDAHFITIDVPAPGALATLGLGFGLLARRRRVA